MSQAGLTAFASTLQTTNVWLHEIMDRLGWQDKHRAYQALRAVLHALRDRLSVEQAAALGAQLPLLIRGVYFEGWRPNGKPLRERHREEFLAHVAAAFHDRRSVDPAEVTQAVLWTLEKHVSAGEIEDVKGLLPADIRALWSEDTHSLWT